MWIHIWIQMQGVKWDKAEQFHMDTDARSPSLRWIHTLIGLFVGVIMHACFSAGI